MNCAMFAKVAEGFFTHINGLDRHSTTVASKRGMELTDNQNTKKELVINFLLLGTHKSCLRFSIIATEVIGFDILYRSLITKGIQFE